MISLRLDLLPVLALLRAGLSGTEAAPTTHGPRPAKEHHHLAERARLASRLSLRVEISSYRHIRHRAHGKVCRARQTAYTPDTSVSSAVVVPSSSAAYSPIALSLSYTEVAVAWQTTSVVPAPAASSSASEQNMQTSQDDQSQDDNDASVSGSEYQSPSGGWANPGSKLGIAWPNGDWAQPSDANYIANYIGTRASWYYTWSPVPVGAADDHGLEFVPMLWGIRQLSDWHAQQSSWPGSVNNALFFNEPNEGSQSDISAGEAVQYWINDYLPVRSRGIKLGAAAVTNAPSGIKWVRDMIETCVLYGNARADCTPDFIPIHWYATSAGDLIAYAKSFWDEFHLPLWITEYACQDFNGGPQCDEGQVWSVHQDSAKWFDETDYVLRYSPFGVMQQMQGVNQMNALMNPGGDITPLGSWYIYNA